MEHRNLCGNVNTFLQPNNGTSKQKEHNKRRKIKYKLKKKQQKLSHRPRHLKKIHFLSNKQWQFTTLKSTSLTPQQKKKLFKTHSLCKIKEQNSAKIFQLQSALTTEHDKNKDTTITTSVKSTSSLPASTILASITSLKSDNALLHREIMKLKKSQISFYNCRSAFLKNSNRTHGNRLRRRLNTLNTNHRHFLQLFRGRLTLSFSNISFLLAHQTKLERQTIITNEELKFKSSNKIHNFTCHTPPEDLISLLNKGTNFIPTTETPQTSSLYHTIHSEVNAALCNLIRKKPSSYKAKPSQATRSLHRFKPYSKQHPRKLLQEEQSRPNFNLHIIDYVHNTISHTQQFLQTTNLNILVRHRLSNITPDLTSHIHRLATNNDIILTMTDKNMGWALVPISWYSTEYKRHFSDTSTYILISNVDISKITTDSNALLHKLKSRFYKTITVPDSQRLLEPTPLNTIQLPYMKLLPKVHKLDSPASNANLNKLTGRPIITAHSWITSNPSRLLGTELDNIILRLKDLFLERNILFPLIYNSTDLLNLLDKITTTNIDDYCLTTFDFTSLYTNITFSDTICAIIISCKLLNMPNSYRDFLLNLNNFINQRNFFIAGNTTYQQIKGVAMGSYHSRQIADLVLLLSEFSFFNNINHSANGIFFFCRYIDDGFMLTNRANLTNIISNLSMSYPSQIPITFTSNQHNVNYLDLTLSLNHYTMWYHKVHYQVYQKPHHKYMYPHFSSNHPKHIFTGIIKTETIRYSRLSATVDDYNFIHKLFSLRLTALNYPYHLITDNSFPWLTHAAHLRRFRQIKPENNNLPTVYYRTKYNKDKRTDKIVHKILLKYHNNHIPKLTKAYCNSTKLHTLLLTNKMLHCKLISANTSST